MIFYAIAMDTLTHLSTMLIHFFHVSGYRTLVPSMFNIHSLTQHPINGMI